MKNIKAIALSLLFVMIGAYNCIAMQSYSNSKITYKVMDNEILQEQLEEIAQYIDKCIEDNINIHNIYKNVVDKVYHIPTEEYITLGIITDRVNTAIKMYNDNFNPDEFVNTLDYKRMDYKIIRVRKTEIKTLEEEEVYDILQELKYKIDLGF